MSNAICCDVCGRLERVRDEYSTNKVMIRDGVKTSGKFTDYDLCTQCLTRIYTLFSEIGEQRSQA